MENTNKKNGKKRPANESGSSDDDESESDTESETEMDQDEKITVEFEAQTPLESDFHGIKQLLGRLFLLQHVDLSELTDLIISQTNAGSTIKVAPDDDDIDIDDGVAASPDDEIYGISSILSLNQHKEKNCMHELKKGILSKCKSNAFDKLETFRNILEKKNVGFLVNERFINIPPQFAVPLHQSLRAEFEEVVGQDTNFKFDYLLMISKTLLTTEQPGCSGNDNDEHKNAKRKKKEKKNKGVKTDEVEYTNVEEEIFHKASEVSFRYSVTEATGLAIGGSWDVGSQLMKPFRTVMLIPETKWKGIVNDIEQLIGT